MELMEWSGVIGVEWSGDGRFDSSRFKWIGVEWEVKWKMEWSGVACSGVE